MLNRYLSQKGRQRVRGRKYWYSKMSANDSASLIDSPKAGMLGLHRAILFNAQEGYLEIFRPYALPSSEWVEHAGRGLQRESGKPALT